MADSLAKPKQIIAQNSDFATTAFLYENGRINLVVFVIATIFAGIILYLIRIERKLNKLEKK
jgi:cell division protein FtsW (lipid II flippase)